MNSSTEKQFRRKINWRRRIVIAFFICAFMVVLVRAIDLQIIDAKHLSALARNEYEGVIEILPKRGDIYDRKGTKLAASIKVPSLYARPADMSDKEKQLVSSQLARVLDINQYKILQKLQTKKTFVWIKRKIHPQQRQEIDNLNISTVGFLPETKRTYPHLSLASNVLGFVGLDGEGLEGLEQHYEKYLKGRKRTQVILKDARKRILTRKPGARDDGSLEGSNLVLTLDKYVQYVVEKELKKVYRNQKAQNALAIVMKPDSGRILAMGSQPSFNPNIFSKFPAQVRRNRNVTDCFEPGSTMKVFTASLVMENHSAQPTDIYFCENGKYRVGKHTINDLHKYGWLSLTKILKVSSNIGALKVAQKLSRSEFHKGLVDFGFGRATDIDLPGETRGLLRNHKKWRSIDKATISFGQGISVSPIQLITGLCAIANGGHLVRPFVVERILDPGGNEIYRNKPFIKHQVISAETAKNMRAILKYVVQEGGTGNAAAINGYSIAGKTGTAQKVEPGEKGYSKSKFVSSFIGFLPADNPQIAVLVMVDEPRVKTYGGLVAAPVFKSICEQIIPYLGIRPSEVLMAQEQIEEASREEKKPAETTEQTEHPKEVILACEDGNPMPNLIGKDVRSALTILDDLDLGVKIVGTGFVIKQYPVPGQSISGLNECKIWLSSQKGLQS